MRTASDAEKNARIDQSFVDLSWQAKNDEFIQSFFDVVCDNSDMSRLREIVLQLQRFTIGTLDEIVDLNTWWNSRTSR